MKRLRTKFTDDFHFRRALETELKQRIADRDWLNRQIRHIRAVLRLRTN
jgi:hypothetical protein